MTFTMSIWLLVVIFTRLAHFLVIASQSTNSTSIDASVFTTCCVVDRDNLAEYARLVQNFGCTVTDSVMESRTQVARPRPRPRTYSLNPKVCTMATFPVEGRHARELVLAHQTCDRNAPLALLHLVRMGTN